MKNDEKMLISIIVPCYNEELCINKFIDTMNGLLNMHNLYNHTEFIFIDDGSTDTTLNHLKKLAENDARVTVLSFSRNFGKEAALTAGLDAARGDVVIPMDVDLQDPPELIPKMLAMWQAGFDVVLAVRKERRNDTWLKRWSAHWYYRLHNRLSAQKIPENAGDFRLMDRKVVDAINRMPENCRFMKGLFSWAGFRTGAVYYERPARESGESKFPFWRLMNFALDGITSFSTVPLRIWTWIGLCISFIAFIYACIIFFMAFVSNIDVPGYASLLCVCLFLGGIQLIGLGMIGEYLGRTYLECKRRPLYIIKDIYKKDDSNGY